MQAHVEELLDASLEAYRATIVAIGDAGGKVYPNSGKEFQQNLIQLGGRLTSEAKPSVVIETGREVDRELREWGSTAASFYQEKAEVVKQIIEIMASNAQVMAQRNERYATQFQSIGDGLRKMSDLNDLPAIRRALLENSVTLKACVENMAKDGQAHVARMRQDMAAYQLRLEKAEQLAATDELTGLGNRRRIERRLKHLEEQHRSFSVVMLDLNDFKDINDRFGHPAGDAVLKHFANELRTRVRSGEIIGRWGGDEFIVVMEASLQNADARAKAIRDWAFGNYVVETGSGQIKVKVSASIGVVEWDHVEPISDLIARADRMMYDHKRRVKESLKKAV